MIFAAWVLATLNGAPPARTDGLFALSPLSPVFRLGGTATMECHIPDGGGGLICEDLRPIQPHDCGVEALKALRGIGPYLNDPDDVGIRTDTLEYRSPSMLLRQQADRLEKESAAVQEARRVLRLCERP